MDTDVISGVHILTCEKYSYWFCKTRSQGADTRSAKTLFKPVHARKEGKIQEVTNKLGF